MKKNLVFIPLLVSLFSCATGYHPMNFAGGYDDFKLASDTYRVRFSGNEFSSTNSVYNLALRRAAELTREKGFRFFKIISASTYVDSSVYVTPQRIDTQTQYDSMHSRGIGAGRSSSTTTVSGGQEVISNKPTTSFEVKMFKNAVKDALDANTILSNFPKSK